MLQSETIKLYDFLGTVFSVPHQLAKLFILEEEIVEAFKTTQSEFDLIEEYLQLWQARNNELPPREENDTVS